MKSIMRNLILFCFVVLTITSCKKENIEIPFNPKKYDFLKNEFIGSTKSYNSNGLISSNVELTQEDFGIFTNTCYLMERIEFNSENQATFYYINEFKDSLINVNYEENVSEIKFERKTDTDPIPTKLSFTKRDSSILGNCYGIKFVLNGNISNGIVFDEMTNEYLQRLVDYMKANDTIYIRQLNVVFKQKF